MHAQHVKRLQILIEDDLYAVLERISKRTGRSKTALVNDLIRKEIRARPSLEEDPLFGLAGYVSFPPADIDATLYGAIERRRHSHRRQATPPRGFGPGGAWRIRTCVL